ncbi:MAG: helix-turn-helix transcriptional regulator [Clostridia bacterium]|nr:helix-turn-helix transcriptional regulator [Clostridia bacterium]MBQ9745610.1 helix-turn-helix transcriptional regulator [Clostridia bacterium]
MKHRVAKPENNIEITYTCSGKAEYAAGEEFSGTKLPFEMFFSVEKGAVSFELGGKTLEASEGEAVLMPCDTEYKISAKEEAVLGFVGFEARIFTVLRILSLFDYRLFFPKESSIFAACKKISDMSAQNDFTNSRLENAIKTVSLLYASVSEITEKSLPLKTGESMMNNFASFADVLSHIGTHLSENIMQETLSGIAGLSPDSFYRQFKKVIGVSPKDYIIAERLRRARTMLVLTDLTVGEVSSAVGYDNQFYFSGLFSKKHGVSPTGYKKSVERIV